MKYEDLRNFILYDMKPDTSSGEPKNYQPVMILVLNQSHGKATKKEILDALEEANPNQGVADGSFNTVCKTLRDHKIVERKGDQYFLLDYETIDKFFGRKAEITKCCYEKIQNSSFTASNLKSISVPKMKNNSFWLASGSWGSWDHTINNPPIRWGTKAKNLWEILAIDDIVFCSASSKRDRIFSKNGIFMVGKVKRKFELEKNDGYYPDAKDDKENFFKYRFEIEPLKIIKTDDELLPLVPNLTARQSINHITNPKVIKELLGNLESMWEIKLNMETNESPNGFEELIQKFDKDRNFFDPDYLDDHRKNDELRKEFLLKFPLGSTHLIKIEDYVTGSGRDDTFCYTIEHVITGFGNILGRWSTKFGVYWKKKENRYDYSSRYASYQLNFDAIKQSISDILEGGRKFQEDQDWEKMNKIFNESDKSLWSYVQSKILCLYFPESFLHIHQRDGTRKILTAFHVNWNDIRQENIALQHRILQIKKTHPIMKNWNMADFSHFVWQVIVENDEEQEIIIPYDEAKMSVNPKTFSSTANYLLLRHNPPEKRKKVDRKYWDDLLGKEYHFGKTVANYSKIIPGTKTVWFYTDKDDLYLWGHGEVNQHHELNIDEFVATMKNFHSFSLDGSAQKIDKSIQKKIKSLQGWSNYNSVITINKEIYDEIINSPSKLKPFVDMPLTKPSASEIKAGLEIIKEELLIPDEKITEIVTSLASGSHVILAGPIGTGKTELARKIPKIFWSKIGGYYSDIFTATADWNTQDVIGGIIPKMDGDKVKYKIQDGCVTESVRKNWDGKLRKYHSEGGNFKGVWTIIDEFNRADIDKAFGQLFTALRTRELKVPTNLFNESHESLKIPKDFRIIGTLNTADKHYLFPLSNALKSRFAFIEVDIPEPSFRDEEIYYAMKNAINSFDGEDFDSVVSLGTKKIIKRNDKFYAAAYQAYNFLSFVRLFKKLGTAILKIIFQNLLTGAKMSLNLNDVLDNAINSTIIPQLEGMSESELGAIKAIQSGKVSDKFKKWNRTAKRNNYENEFKKILEFLEIKNKTFDEFSDTEIKDDAAWNDLQKSFDNRQNKTEDVIANNLTQVEKSLDALLADTVI